MPHSSGGGSHGGGFHSGGFHSSGSGAGSKHISKSYYPGSSAFVRYHNGKTDVVYSDRDITKVKKSEYTVVIGVILFITLFMSMFFVKAYKSVFKTVLPPKKLNTDYNTAIVIDDTLGIISDEDTMKKNFEKFFGYTGITPSVHTVTDERWSSSYSSLKDYAYDYYVTHFDDEKHWLIVYSKPESPIPGFDDWSWEGMQGNDTDGIINEITATDFNSRLHNYLLNDSKYTFEDAINKAFEEISPRIMQRQVSQRDKTNTYMILTFLLFMWGLPVLVFITVLVRIQKFKKYKPLKEGAEGVSVRKKCDICGGTYFPGTDQTCPHCGAPVNTQNKKDATPSSAAPL